MKFLVAIISLLAAYNARSGELWETSMITSKHYHNSDRYNEINPGFGLEYSINDDVSLIGGFYKNSLSHQSDYLGLSYTPLKIGSVKLGAFLGGVNGYKLNNGEFVPLLAGVVMIKLFQSIGLNLIFTPTVKHINQGAVALQLKFK